MMRVGRVRLLRLLGVVERVGVMGVMGVMGGKAIGGDSMGCRLLITCCEGEDVVEGGRGPWRQLTIHRFHLSISFN